MLLRKISYLTLTFFLLCFCRASFANLETLENITSAIKTFVANNVSMDPDETLEVSVVTRNDAPLRLPVCPEKLTVALPDEANRDQITSVKLSCEVGKRPWNVYVPVSVGVYSNVIVAKRTILQKETISENDVDLVRHDKNRLFSGFYKKKDDVVGQIATQIIPSGTILTKKNTQLPMLVRRGQTVDVQVKSNSIMVVMKGVAKSDGVLNESIKVFNPSSSRMLDATVVGLNKVEIVS